MAETEANAPLVKVPAVKVKAYRCAGPRILDEDGKPTAKRKGCRTNLTALILKVPQDGEEHKVTCPKCKNVSLIRRVPEEAPEEETAAAEETTE